VTAAFSRVAAVLLAVLLTWVLAGAGAARPADPPAATRPLPGHRDAARIGAPTQTTPTAAAAPSRPAAAPVHDTASPPGKAHDALVLAALALAIAFAALYLAAVRGTPRGAA
jgi:hypothetical protein